MYVCACSCYSTRGSQRTNRFLSVLWCFHLSGCSSSFVSLAFPRWSLNLGIQVPSQRWWTAILGFWVAVFEHTIVVLSEFHNSLEWNITKVYLFGSKLSIRVAICSPLCALGNGKWEPSPTEKRAAHAFCLHLYVLHELTPKVGQYLKSCWLKEFPQRTMLTTILGATLRIKPLAWDKTQ